MMTMRSVVPFVLFSLLTMACGRKASSSEDDSMPQVKHIKQSDTADSAPTVCHMRIERHEGLTFYFPLSYTVDFVCETRPGENDGDVIYCAEAAFTGQCLDKFDHFNIAGNHVSGGKYHRGYRAKTNSGAFVYYNGKWKFLCGSYDAELKKAANNGGMGFGQNMIIYGGTVKKAFRKDSPLNIYRALCETEDKELCIVESDSLLRYSDFTQRLSKSHIRHALYLDMGGGWNYSWYRDSLNRFHALHPKTYGSKYQTNWIVFKKTRK